MIRVYDAEDGFQVAVVSVHGLQDAAVGDLQQKMRDEDTERARLSRAHLQFGLGDGELPYPLLVIHQA